MNKYLLALSAVLIGAQVQAATPAALPAPVKQLEKQGIEIIKPFTAPGGVQGWLGKYQGTGVTIYLTPDKKHAISGYMYDENGSNLSEKVIQEEIYIPAGREMWQTLLKAPGIMEGSDKASCQIVVFADPFCPYCKKFRQEVQPYIKDNNIAMKTQLVGVMQPDSGRYAAAILSSDNPAKVWQDFELSGGKSKPALLEKTPQPIFSQIQYNQKLMDDLGANGTPAIYYLNHANMLQQIVGLPDKDQMANLVACK
ncbi:thiol:disulfide interchange protein DsbG [Serratia plymuthica]|uniref:thiol:disulfide interchange protein DsbG n=1 Tax=Serratia plymuthica TaxID=82996 RepID=UPI001BAEC6B4|nr:thiol:disulfide interchange protein DsbG [Serratia plymuthica]QUY46556.1 thiol:disulfide interchange protein DsbG [Serratia plymuthica]